MHSDIYASATVKVHQNAQETSSENARSPNVIEKVIFYVQTETSISIADCGYLGPIWPVLHININTIILMKHLILSLDCLFVSETSVITYFLRLHYHENLLPSQTRKIWPFFTIKKAISQKFVPEFFSSFAFLVLD